MKKRFSVLILLSVILMLVLSSCSAVSDLKTIGDMGKAFMTALEEKDTSASWNMLAPGVQTEIGDEIAWADWATIRSFPDWKFTNTEISNGVGQMDGEATLEGVTYQVTLVFDKIDEVWKISGINFE